MRRRDIISIYASGLCELCLSALGFAITGLILLQTCAMVFETILNAEAVLLFFWQCIMLMALWPGQTFWTIRRKTSAGREHSIIGAPSEDDIVAQNRVSARRFCNRTGH